MEIESRRASAELINAVLSKTDKSLFSMDSVDVVYDKWTHGNFMDHVFISSSSRE